MSLHFTIEGCNCNCNCNFLPPQGNRLYFTYVGYSNSLPAFHSLHLRGHPPHSFSRFCDSRISSKFSFITSPKHLYLNDGKTSAYLLLTNGHWCHHYSISICCKGFLFYLSICLKWNKKGTSFIDGFNNITDSGSLQQRFIYFNGISRRQLTLICSTLKTQT